MKIRFSYIVLLIALAIATTSAYFSIWGLSKIFAGASTSIIILGIILETGKIATTTILHKFWKKLAVSLKIYLVIAVLLLIFVNSGGIFGFLSNAYESNKNDFEIHQEGVNILETKTLSFKKIISDNEKTIISKNKRIEQLSNLRNNQEKRIDSAKTNKERDKVRNDISIQDTQIKDFTKNIDELNNKNFLLYDSINKYKTKVLELQSGNETIKNIGPLLYISRVSGLKMDSIVFYLVIILCFLVDPLALALILVFNRIFELENEVNLPEKKNEKLSDVVTESINDMIKEEPILEELVEEKEILLNESIIKEPSLPTGKIKLEDIKEIKESNRGYSVPVPQPKGNNTIERIGSNKVVKNGDNNKFIFKRK